MCCRSRTNLDGHVCLVGTGSGAYNWLVKFKRRVAALFKFIPSFHRRHQPRSSAAIGIMFASRDTPRPFTPTSCREMGLDDLLELLTEFITRDIPTLKLSNADRCVVPIGIMTGYID